MTVPAEIRLPCFDASNRLVARLRIAAPKVRPESVRELSEAEARQHLEARCQVREGSVYEYRLEDIDAGWRVDRDEIVQPNAFDETAGRIDATNITGLTSSKLDYRTQYRAMVDDVASEVAGLVVDCSGRTGMDPSRFAPSPRPSPPVGEREIVCT